MEAESYSKSACAHCGGHIAYPASRAGTTVACPHCGQETLLPADPAAPARRRLWPVFAGLVVLLCAGAWALIQHRSAHSESAPPAPANTPMPPPAKPPRPDPWHGLFASEVTLEKQPGSRLVYAVGTVSNESDRQRFGVKVELDLFDPNEVKVGSATDYTQVIEPGKQWKFKALVTDPSAVRAQLTAVREQ